VDFGNRCGGDITYVSGPADMGLLQRQRAIQAKLRRFQECTYLADSDLFCRGNYLGHKKRKGKTGIATEEVSENG
jgi:hypothetical protein